MGEKNPSVETTMYVRNLRICYELVRYYLYSFSLPKERVGSNSGMADKLIANQNPLFFSS